MIDKKGNILIFVLLLVVLPLSVIIASAIGVVNIPLTDILNVILSKIGLSSSNVPAHFEVTLLQLRFPRIIMSVLVGAALAACGCVFQSIFRNPICDPYILGISSGSSLGGAISFIMGWNLLFFGVTIPALVTGLLTLLLILGINRMSRKANVETLLLVGIAVNFLISAVITLLMVLNQQEMHKIIFWTMGSLASVSWIELAMMAVMTLICVFPFFYYAKDLNIMQIGNSVAQNLGVNTKKVTCTCLIFSSLLIASAVSFCGVIGFIGLIIPHIVRILFGNNMRTMLVFSLLFGAFFLLVADTLARTMATPSELPVGSITALAGAPYFLFLLLRKK